MHFHKWSKWREVKWLKHVWNDSMNVVQLPLVKQERECSACGKKQVRNLNDR